MENKFCEAGGAYRSSSGYIEEVCKYCKRDMPYEEKDGAYQQLDISSRLCRGYCEQDCDYVYPYGFVPEAGCIIHDK